MNFVQAPIELNKTLGDLTLLFIEFPIKGNTFNSMFQSG